MLTKTDIIQKLQSFIPELREWYGVEKIELFGSVSRDEGSENSDLDLIVKYRKRPQGRNYFSLGIYLEEVFEMKIDLVTQKEIRPELKEKILNQVQYV